MQVKRNEELRELLEQRSMTSPDDVHVLTRELSQLHAILSEKEADWERRLGEMGANLLLAQKQNGVLEQRLAADRTEALSKEVSPDKQLILSPDKQLILSPDKQLILNPDKQLILSPDKQLILSPDKQLILSPDKQLILSPDKQLILRH